MDETDTCDTAEDLVRIRRCADLIYTNEEVEAAYDRLASDINNELAERDPLVCCVLLGGIVPTGHLLTRFTFLCEVGYLHATRYRGATSGGDLHWLAKPFGDLEGRTVLVIDDILDEGNTLAAIEGMLRNAGATVVYKAVLTRKRRRRPPVTDAHFVGLEVPDRYVFGCGMDYHGYWRNLPEIHAVNLT